MYLNALHCSRLKVNANNAPATIADETSSLQREMQRESAVVLREEREISFSAKSIGKKIILLKEEHINFSSLFHSPFFLELNQNNYFRLFMNVEEKLYHFVRLQTKKCHCVIPSYFFRMHIHCFRCNCWQCHTINKEISCQFE